KLIAEVNKLSDKGRKSDKSEAIKYLAEFAAKRGLQIRGTQKPVTEWELEGDPNVAPLVAAFRDSLRDPRNPHLEDYFPFAQFFFWRPGERGGRNPAIGTFAPEFFPPARAANPFEMEKHPQFVVWRKEEKPSESIPFDLNNPPEVVKAAWKRLKAR